MKKTLSIILALTLVFAMSVPALAANEASGTTAISYTVASNYTITIPSSVVLAPDGTVLKGSGAVSVNEGSVIDAGKKLTFTITGATNYAADPAGFKLLNASKAGEYLSYSIGTSAGDSDVVKDTAFLSATAAECNDGKTVTLHYTTGTFESAGEYSDTITISIAEVAA